MWEDLYDLHVGGVECWACCVGVVCRSKFSVLIILWRCMIIGVLCKQSCGVLVMV